MWYTRSKGKECATVKKALVIGIAGGSASGKSTLCENMEHRLSDYKVKALHLDEYFRPPAERPVAPGPVTAVEYLDDNHPETMDLPAFRRDLSAAAEGDWDIVLAEGLLILWDDDTFSQLDLGVFVDCRADERIVRRLRRNMGWGLTFDQVSNVYLDLVRYRHDEYVEPSRWRADVVVNGSRSSEKMLDMLCGWAENAVREKV